MEVASPQIVRQPDKNKGTQNVHAPRFAQFMVMCDQNMGFHAAMFEDTDVFVGKDRHLVDKFTGERHNT